MRFSVEKASNGRWRVMLDSADAPLSEHDSKREAKQRMAEYEEGMRAAIAPTRETGIARGRRVALRDGSDVIVRSVEPEDKALLVEGFSRFSQRSRYQRFFSSKPRLTIAELAYFTEVDHDTHEAVGGIDPETGAGVGIARFVRDDEDRDRAEAALAVADAWQGRGVGRVLIEELAGLAIVAGVEVFTASLLTGNATMRALFDRLGEMHVYHEDGAISRVTVKLDPEATDGVRAAVRAASG